MYVRKCMYCLHDLVHCVLKADPISVCLYSVWEYFFLSRYYCLCAFVFLYQLPCIYKRKLLEPFSFSNKKNMVYKTNYNLVCVCVCVWIVTVASSGFRPGE